MTRNITHYTILEICEGIGVKLGDKPENSALKYKYVAQMLA